MLAKKRDARVLDDAMLGGVLDAEGGKAAEGLLSITSPEQRQAKSGKAARASQTPCSSCFQLTLNEIQRFESLKEYLLQNANFAYGIAAQECAPSTGHLHIHCYVQFGRSVRLSLKKLEGAHVEKCYGSPQQNVDYVKKDGDIIWEEGTLRKKGGVTIAQVKEMPKEEREQLPLQLYNIVQKVNTEEAKAIKIGEWHKEVKCYYIWGESGIGKSRHAEELVQKAGFDSFNLIRYENGFWHGVSENCPAAIYDEWRDSQMKPYELIQLLDYNIHPMNVKGGTVKNKYKLIILTTIQDPARIYANVSEEQRFQWERRMVVRHLVPLEKMG